MFSVETQVGIGMKDLGHGEPLLRDTLEKLPRIPAPLAATSDNAQPALTYLDPKAPEAREFPGYSIIVEVDLYYLPQRSPYLHHEYLQARAQSPFYLIHLYNDSLSEGTVLHHDLAG